jgi:MFS transporter, PAT family, beta-lactamase induction signal transducer AmpG
MGESAITRDPAGRFVLLATLYFAQGLPYGFFSVALPVLLRQQGVSLSKIGLTSLLVLPWALKFLWAPVLDRVYSRRFGRRRTWILAMQLSATIVLATIALVPGSDRMIAMMVAMFFLNVIAATQDIATDGLAVELLPPQERGFANGLQVAGYRIGMVVGGGVLLGAYAELGHRGLFAIMAGLTALATIPVLAASEPPTVTAEKPLEPDVHFLELPGAWRIIALVVIYKAGDEAAKAIFRPFLVDQHLELSDIAYIVGTVGFVAGMVGAIVGGTLVGAFGRKRALLVFGLGQVITVLGYAYLASGQPSYRELYAWTGFEYFASGMATAALFTAMMDWSRPTYSGTDYTVQASAVVIATGSSAMLGGPSAELLGYTNHFLVCAALCVVSIAAVAWLFPKTFPTPTVPQARSLG